MRLLRCLVLVVLSSTGANAFYPYIPKLGAIADTIKTVQPGLEKRALCRRGLEDPYLDVVGVECEHHKAQVGLSIWLFSVAVIR